MPSNPGRNTGGGNCKNDRHTYEPDLGLHYYFVNWNLLTVIIEEVHLFVSRYFYWGMSERCNLKIEPADTMETQPLDPTGSSTTNDDASDSLKVLSSKHTTLCTEYDEELCSRRVASARSSGASSAYYSSTSSCLFDYTSTPISTIKGSLSKRRPRLCCEQDITSIFSADRSDKDAGGSIEENEAVEEVGQLVGQPSLKMIRKLKRMSDAWSRVSRSADNDSEIIDRLKKGREEAKRRQTYIEVGGPLGVDSLLTW